MGHEKYLSGKAVKVSKPVATRSASPYSTCVKQENDVNAGQANRTIICSTSIK